MKAFVCALFPLLSGGLLVSAAATAQVGAGSALEQLILPQEGGLAHYSSYDRSGGVNDQPDVEYATVAYWYQTHPHSGAPPLPANLLPRVRPRAAEGGVERTR